MRISFDLDDTLICYQPGVRQEPNRVPWWLRWWVNEPLRLGAVDLMRDLAATGHELWVYTTSYRDPAAVRWWFWWYGVKIRYVVNQSRHERFRQQSVKVEAKVDGVTQRLSIELAELQPQNRAKLREILEDEARHRNGHA